MRNVATNTDNSKTQTSLSYCYIQELSRASSGFLLWFVLPVVKETHLWPPDFCFEKKTINCKNIHFIHSFWIYLAPEVLSGGPYNHAADWWSLGITLLSLVTGKVTTRRPELYQVVTWFCVGHWSLCICLFFFSVSNSCRVGPQLHVGQGQRFSLWPAQDPQLCSHPPAHWGHLTSLPSMECNSCKLLHVFTLTLPGRCSSCAKTRKLGSGTWSVSRCSPSSAALPLTPSSFRRNPSTSSSSSGLTPIGRPPPREALRTLTVLESFSLLRVISFLLWAAWSRATKELWNERSSVVNPQFRCFLNM